MSARKLWQVIGEMCDQIKDKLKCGMLDIVSKNGLQAFIFCWYWKPDGFPAVSYRRCISAQNAVNLSPSSRELWIADFAHETARTWQATTRARNAWQPIDTAPKEVSVLVSFQSIGPLAISVVDICSFRDGHWRWGDGRVVPCEPTHWMLLPYPPEAAE